MAKPTEELLQELTELTAIQGKTPSEIKRIHTIRVCLNRRGVKIPSKSQLINSQSESKYDLSVTAYNFEDIFLFADKLNEYVGAAKELIQYRIETEKGRKNKDR